MKVLIVILLCAILAVQIFEMRLLRQMDKGITLTLKGELKIFEMAKPAKLKNDYAPVEVKR